MFAVCLTVLQVRQHERKEMKKIVLDFEQRQEEEEYQGNQVYLYCCLVCVGDLNLHSLILSILFCVIWSDLFHVSNVHVCALSAMIASQEARTQYQRKTTKPEGQPSRGGRGGHQRGGARGRGRRNQHN